MSALLGAVAAMLSAALAVTPGATADYQLGGPYPPAEGVGIVVRDRSAEPDPDAWSVCYVNAFQTQPDELGWWEQHHPDLLLRDEDGLVTDPGWPDEVLLDVTTAGRRAAIADVVGGWIDGCADAGFDAVEPDNLDAWTRSGGLTTRTQTIALARLLVERAHRRGLPIAQKNTTDLAGAGIGFDLAVAEECEVYRECEVYTDAYGSRVIEVEYTDTGRAPYERACRLRAGEHPIMLRDRDVLPAGTAGHVAESC